MPHRDVRVQAAAKAGKLPTAGRMNVIYRGSDGGSRAATVIGPGSVSGLKLRIGSRMGTTLPDTIDNVAAATAAKQTNVYFSRDRI